MHRRNSCLLCIRAYSRIMRIMNGMHRLMESSLFANGSIESRLHACPMIPRLSYSWSFIVFFSEQFKTPPLQCLQLRSVFRNIKTAISLLPEFPMRYTLSEYCMNRNIAYAHSYYFPVIWILRSYDFCYHAPITLMIKQQCHITIMGLFKKINLFEFLAESLFESIFGLNYCSDKTNQRQFWTMNRLIAVMPCLWFTLIPV